MRIVDVCAFYTPVGGGVKTYVERKLRTARAGSREIVIVVPGERDGTRRVGDAGSIVTIASPRFPLDRRYRYFADEAALHRVLDGLAPDVIEASSPWNSPAMVARWQGDAVRSLVMHADPLSAYAYRWFGGVAARDTIDRGFDWFWRHLRRLDDSFDMIVCASDSLSTRLRAGGLRKVTTIPMGVEPGVFSPSHRDEALRARLLARCGLGPEATLLVGAGRLAPEKRWPMVIEATTAAGYARPVGLVLLGNGRDRARVVRTVAANPHIHLGAPITERDAFARVLASADALVHGCEAETFCMVAAEARASGLPLIVPDDGGAGDQFVAGQGYSYPAHDAAGLAGAIGTFLADGSSLHRGAAILAAPQIPDMDDHFARLFAAYDRAAMRVSAAA
jgi:alpha-1,6-mannosyltransferase